MKKLKQILSVLAALVLVVGMTFSSVFAVTAEQTKGSITVDPANEGQTYTIYRIFDLESYNANKEAFAYKVNSAWEDFFAAGGKGLDYVTVSDSGYVTWKKDADEKSFAKDALAFAKTNQIANSGSETADSKTVKFENLDLGYYLIDTTTGSLLGLTTTSPDAKVHDKNGIPTVDKKVAEDSVNDELGKSNDATIGDTVNFETTIHAQPGAKNYILHDTMDAGLTFNEDSVVVKEGDITLVAATDYVLKTPGENHLDENVKCTFEIVFTESYLNSIEEETLITVTYSATVNENAVIAGNGNDNSTKLTYGEKSETETEPSNTKTYVWEFDILKYTSKTEDGKTTTINLAGAEFEIYEVKKSDKEETKTKLHFILSDGVYKVATAAQIQAGGTVDTITSGNDGKIYLEGLDEGTYEVVETKAPDGYNKLKDPFRVVISSNSANRDAVILIPEITVENDDENPSVDWDASNNQVKVLNTTGSKLPETGGMGTTYLYLAGCLLVLGSAVLMIVRKRMSAE